MYEYKQFQQLVQLETTKLSGNLIRFLNKQLKHEDILLHGTLIKFHILATTLYTSYCKTNTHKFTKVLKIFSK